jgi:hypothetical protein
MYSFDRVCCEIGVKYTTDLLKYINSYVFLLSFLEQIDLLLEVNSLASTLDAGHELLFTFKHESQFILCLCENEVTI